MQTPGDSDDYRYIFLHDIPVLDTRAPTEFAQGAFPNAKNCPLMTDEERAEVGTCYKKQGQQAAIALGHRLVHGEIKDKRVAVWQDFATQHPNGYIYCFRGGLRSQISQQWLAEAGINYPRILGGYKAMRRFLIDELEHSVATADLVLLSGATGSGKTRVIETIDSSIDLEGLAKHRGSAFGHLIVEQPTQISFENALSIEFLKALDSAPQRKIFLEDEGRLIGRIALPQFLIEKMSSSPLVVIEEDFESRINVLVDDYVLDLGRRFQEVFAEGGPERHRDKLLNDLSRIKKRLGSERHQKTSALLAQAFIEQQATDSLQLHREWIAILLGEYYDPMYQYQLARRRGEVLFRGSRQEIADWIVKQSEC